MTWADLSTAALERHIDLQWAADTTEDSKWREQHLADKAICERIIKERKGG